MVEAFSAPHICTYIHPSYMYTQHTLRHYTHARHMHSIYLLHSKHTIYFLSPPTHTSHSPKHTQSLYSYHSKVQTHSGTSSLVSYFNKSKSILSLFFGNSFEDQMRRWWYPNLKEKLTDELSRPAHLGMPEHAVTCRFSFRVSSNFTFESHYFFAFP